MRQTTRIPKLLYGYLATEMLAPFFASFIVMNGVFVLVKLAPFLNVVLELEVNFSDFLRLFCYLFPNIFIYSIPMASMMGVILSFTRLSADREILALKASGVSIYQMIPPITLVSLVIAIITGYFSIALIPRAELSMKQLMFQIAKEQVEKGIKEKHFTEALGDLVVYIDAIDKQSGEWMNVWISDMRGQVQPIITMAQSGTMDADINDMMVSITLHNGSSHRPDGNRAQIVDFEKYTLNIPIQVPTIIGGDNVAKQTPHTMTMGELQESANRWGRDTTDGRGYLISYHKRIILPVGCFILSLLGIPLGLQTGFGRKAVGIPLGLGFFILYYILFTTGKMLAEEAALPVNVAMWLPNMIFLCVALYLIRQAVEERSLIPEKIKNLLSHTISRITNFAHHSKRRKSQ